MYLYAIKELNNDLYINKHYNIEPLGDSTLLFSNAEQPSRMIKYEDPEGFIREPLVDSLVWNLLEKKYHKDRWHINPTRQEILEIKDNINLKVVKVCLIDLDEQEESN